MSGAKEQWRRDINYGPDGQEDWANLITPEGDHVANIRTHHADRIVREINAALSRSAEAGKPVVKVKPLEWEDQSDAVVTFHVTRNQIGMSYVVTVENLMTFAHSGSREVARFPSLAVEAAKAAAQADYEARIRSALSTPADIEPVAWPIATDDQVEALARECGWDNRKYMTQKDYSIWCERMRTFARLAVPSPPDWAIEQIDRLTKALEPFSTLQIPKKAQYNAGAYSIRHSDIEAARAALSSTKSGEVER